MSGPEVTLLENRSEPVGGGFHLLVMGPDVFTIHPLPLAGLVVIGRGDGAEVRLDDPLASRQHARLHVTPGGWEVEDLGSANKTRVRDQTLAPGERVTIAAGEAITIGATILMVQQRLPARVRVLRPHGYMQARLEEECARSELSREPFALARLKVEKALAPAEIVAALSPVLRLPDMLALYGPNEYEVLLASVAPELATSLTEKMLEALRQEKIPARLGLALYPRHGRTPEELLASASARVRDEAPPSSHISEIEVRDPVMERVYRLADRAAAGTINVLVVGETGVGKELMAERIHRASARAEKPYLCLNCASFSESLLESELFGHERGAFTGASEAKPGLLETAPGGTIFLDEMGEMPLPLQAKLLRVLETKQVTRVGGLKPRSIDVRFIAATNRNLEQEVAEGRFRRDLYFRLNGMTLLVPPLRSRLPEILPLARLFLDQFAATQKRAAPELSQESELMLQAHLWPGNVRELRNMMERAVLLCDDTVEPEHLLLDTIAMAVPPPSFGPPPTTMAEEDQEREHILRVLASCGGNQTRAAKLLHMARSTLVLRLDGYRVVRPRKP